MLSTARVNEGRMSAPYRSNETDSDSRTFERGVEKTEPKRQRRKDTDDAKAERRREMEVAMVAGEGARQVWKQMTSGWAL